VSTTFYLKQGDTLPIIEAQLFGSDNAPMNLQGAQVRFRMGDIVDAPAEITNAVEGRVRYAWQPGDTDAPGTHKTEWHVTLISGESQTVPNDGYLQVVISRKVGEK